MKTIHKFQVPALDEFTILMPEGAQILHIAVQHNEPQMWALVDLSKPVEQRSFRLRGTGYLVDFSGVHVGSFLMHEGALVFHIFEVAR